MANVSLRSKSALPSHLHFQPCAQPTYVDFRILEAFLQIVIDSLVRYLANECKIRDSDLLLLGALKGGLSNLRLSPSAAGRLRIASVLLAAGALCYCLSKPRISLFLKVGKSESRRAILIPWWFSLGFTVQLCLRLLRDTGTGASKNYAMSTDIDFRRCVGSKNVCLFLGPTGKTDIFNDVPFAGLASSAAQET